MPAQQTVLLLDDDPLLLAALRRSLRTEPYQMLLAETPSAALWILQTSSVDVLVTDQQMPGMSGAEFLTRVRAEHPHVISIMLTGHADLSTAITAINSGEVYRFFTKPCETESLAVAIRQALQLKALIRQSRRLLGTVRRQAAALTTTWQLGDAGDAGDAAEMDEPPIYEADPSPVDLPTLLREIEAEIEAAEKRQAVHQSRGDSLR